MAGRVGQRTEMGIAQLSFLLDASQCAGVARDNHERRGIGQLKRGETANERTRGLPLLKGQAGIIRRSEEGHHSIWDSM